MRRDPAKAILVLGLLTEFFGEFGHRWISGMYADSYGGRCLVSALYDIRAQAKIAGDETEYYIYQAIPPSAEDIEPFNDDCRSYDEIRAVILAARDLAQAELDAAGDRTVTPDLLRCHSTETRSANLTTG
jgi:hypothetical protein